MVAGAYTLKDAAEHVYRDVRGGASPGSELVRDRINQALALALKAQYAKGVFNTWVVNTHQANRELLLPPEIETAELVKTTSRGLRIRSQWYSFSLHTVAETEMHKAQCLGLEDLGDGWVHDQNLCDPQFIMAMVEQPHGTPNEEHLGLKIHIQGNDVTGDPVWGPDGTPGFYLPLVAHRPSYSDFSETHIPLCVQTITAVNKPLTKWPVVLYGYKDVKTLAQLEDGQSPTLTQIARLLPWETAISRRKYRFVGQDAVPAQVEVFGRYRFRSLQFDHEILPVQDLSSIRQLIMQLESEKAGKLQEAIYHQGQAQNDLDRSLKKHAGNVLMEERIKIANDGSSGYGDIYSL